MNKTELITAVRKATGLGKDEATRAVEATFDAIVSTLETGEKVGIVGFGTFDTKAVAASDNKRNPSNGETISVAAHRKPTFKYADKVKDTVRNT